MHNCIFYQAFIYSFKDFKANVFFLNSKMGSGYFDQKIHLNTFLLNNMTWTLGDSDKDECEREITLHEVRSAIKSFANDKSQECDGLTAEFYQTCFGLIGSDLGDVINYAFENETLTLTMRRGIVVLIWKGNEREYLKNGARSRYLIATT